MVIARRLFKKKFLDLYPQLKIKDVHQSLEPTLDKRHFITVFIAFEFNDKNLSKLMVELHINH